MRSLNKAQRELVKLLDDAGGVDFLSISGLALLLLPISLFTSLLTAGISTSIELLGWFFGNALGFTLVAPVALLIRRRGRIKSNGLQFRAKSVLVISGLIGGFKAGITSLGATLILLPSLSLDLERVLLGALAGMVGIPLASLVMRAWRQFEIDRETLLALHHSRQAKLATTRDEGSQLIALRRKIAELASKVQGGGSNLLDPRSELEEIRQILDFHLRPLSASMFEAVERRYPSLSLRTLLRAALESEPPAHVMALLYFCTFPYVASINGVLAGLVGTALGALLVFTFIKLAFIMIRSSGRAKPVLHIAIVVASAPLASALSSALVSLDPAQNPYLLQLAAVWFSHTSITVSMVQVARERARINRESLNEFSSTGEANPPTSAVLLLRRRALASQLHGEVQSRLMTLLLRSEAGAEIERELVVQELKLIDELLSTQASRIRGSLAEEIDRLANQWSGIASVDFDLGGLRSDITQSGVLVEVIEQGLVNAFRHGLATSAEVRISLTNAALKLEVWDNGLGPKAGPPGLGSRLLDSSAQRWSLIANDSGGSTLSIQFAISQDHSV